MRLVSLHGVKWRLWVGGEEGSLKKVADRRWKKRVLSGLTEGCPGRQRRPGAGAQEGGPGAVGRDLLSPTLGPRIVRCVKVREMGAIL